MFAREKSDKIPTHTHDEVRSTKDSPVDSEKKRRLWGGRGAAEHFYFFDNPIKSFFGSEINIV